MAPPNTQLWKRAYDLRQQGFSCREIASQLGVSRTRASQAVHQWEARHLAPIVHPRRLDADIDWRIINGTDYMIDRTGRVRSLPRLVVRKDGTTARLQDRILKSRVDHYGYMAVILCVHGKHLTRKIHHLVLETFIGSAPAGHQAAHNDGDKTNNRLENLRWATPKDNSADKIAHGTLCWGVGHGRAKLSEADVKQIRELLIQRIPHGVIAQRFGIHVNHVGRIKSGERWGRLAKP